MIEFCSDGVLQAGLGEECDDGNLADDDGCSSTCLIEFCGDSVQQASEQCDDGNTVSEDGCSSICVIEFCGDEIVQVGLGEECDDGNTVSGDGCSDICEMEAPVVTPGLGILGMLCLVVLLVGVGSAAVRSSRDSVA